MIENKENSLRTIFLDAIEIADAGECAAYLDRTCGDDRSLRQRLEQLLKAHADAGGFASENRGISVPRSVAEKHGGISLSSPVRFGDYELLEEIARGGMGVVYKARQATLDRFVAVKTILAGASASKEFIHRFRTEAAAAANLQHPNIVAVHEVGAHQGENYLVMDFVDGPNLARVVGQRPLPARKAAQYVQAVAAAIHFAHERGILHRDLKPSNVLIDANDQPRVTDFGLAKRLDGEGDLTLSGQVLGSPNFMAPEQASGSRGKVSRRTDVYGLGAMLYHALTARPPFQADTLTETLQQVVRAEPVSPRLLNPSLPRDLETITLKCLEKEPHRRYPTAESLAQELERWLAGRPILARRVTALERVWLWSRRQPVAASVLLLLLLLATSLSFATYHLRQQRNQAQRHLWQSYLAQGAALRSSGDAGRRQRALDALTAAARIRPSVAVRNEAIASLALEDLQIRRKWAGAPDGTTAVCVDDQQRVYARAGTDRISVLDLESDSELVSLSGTSTSAFWLRFSPDGNYLAARFALTNRPVDLRIWLWRSHELLMELPCSLAAFEAQSKTVFVGGADGEIRQLSLPDGKELARVSVGRAPDQLAPSPTGEWLAVRFKDEPGSGGEMSYTVKVFNLRTRATRSFAYRGDGEVRSLAWHPDGEILAVGCNDYRVYEEHVETQKRIRFYEWHETPVVGIAYNSDATRLASIEHDGTLVIGETRRDRKIISTRVERANLSFAPDSNRLGTGMDPPYLTVWNLERSTGFFNIPGTHSYCSSLSFSPDGRYLVLVNPFVDLLVVDLHRRCLVASHPIKGIRSGWFDRSGRHFITSGNAGVQEWPFQLTERVGDDALVFGIPRALDFPVKPPCEYAAPSADQRKLAVRDSTDLFVGEFGNPTNWHALGVRLAVRLSFSPDNRWLATVSGRDNVMSVWDLQTFTPVLREFSPADTVVFSPDGRWFIAATGRQYRVWRVGSWQLHRQIKGEGVEGVHQSADFSPDGRLLAIVRHLQTVQLLDADTSTELATLRAPELSTIHWVKFSPDGARLVVMTRTRGLQVWDLPALRSGLASMGLDW